MQGKGIIKEEMCDPYKTNSQMGVTKSVTGANLNPGDVAIPCGVAAKYFFNDIY